MCVCVCVLVGYVKVCAGIGGCCLCGCCLCGCVREYACDWSRGIVP